MSLANRVIGMHARPRGFAAFVLLAALACSARAAAAPEFSGRDVSVAPGGNFFAYANGTWLRDTRIPADHGSYGVFEELQELADRRNAELIGALARSDAPPGSDARRIEDYYASFLDDTGIEAKGFAPLAPELEAIAAIHSPADLSGAFGGTLRADVDVLNNTQTHTSRLFGLWVAQDLDEPSRYLPFLLQGGLVMPDREYYLDGSPRMEKIRARYLVYIAGMLQLAGDPASDAQARAGRILALETQIAQVHARREDTEDVRKGDNHWTRAQFDLRAPGIDWGRFFHGAGLEHQKDFVVWHPQALAGISALVATVPVETWKEYLRFHLLDDYAPVLPRAFVEAAFAFHGKTLTGTPQIAERWKRAIAATNDALGEAVGRLYVERYFPASEKLRAEQMVHALIAAFDARIDRLDWMAPQTRRMAKAKLSALQVSVGYPDHWRDYAGLEVIRGDAAGNLRRALLFEYQRSLAKLGQPVDRGEWVMNPQLVNAVNLPVMNAIQFPAAILQPPHFGGGNNAAQDYGEIGAVIGHEITHSFDDQGALFDPDGRLHNWWTPQDLEHFEAAGAALAHQYDGYRPFPDLAVKGKQTLSENIADLGGLLAAFDAYHLSLGDAKPPSVEGLDPDQQFFVAFAQSWRDKAREPALRQQIITDGHAPAEYRVDTVRNVDAWYRAFDVRPGDALFLAPAARVRIW